jgi:hypothetical protein
VNAAKQLLPGNASTLWTSLYCQVTAADVYAQVGQRAKRDAALASGRDDERALEAFPNLPTACLARWTWLRDLNQETTILDQLRRISEQVGYAPATTLHALTLYRHHELGPSLAALETRRGLFHTDRLRPIILADLDGNPSRALAAYEEFAALDINERERLDALMTLRLLGHKQESQALARALPRDPQHVPSLRRPSYRRLREYTAGDLSAADLLTASAASRVELCYAHFFIGITMLVEGDRDAAREQFRAVMATHSVLPLHYGLSWAFLARMEQDRGWPRWLPVKK